MRERRDSKKKDRAKTDSILGIDFYPEIVYDFGVNYFRGLAMYCPSCGTKCSVGKTDWGTIGAVCPNEMIFYYPDRFTLAARNSMQQILSWTFDTETLKLKVEYQIPAGRNAEFDKRTAENHDPRVCGLHGSNPLGKCKCPCGPCAARRNGTGG